MTAARTLLVTPAERACATVLRTVMAWQDTPNNLSGEVDIAEWHHHYKALVKWGDDLQALDYLDSRLDLTPTGAALLARVEAAERTPETVLRAMLVSYEADAIEKARAYYADPGVDASLLRATNEADTDVEIVRDQLAILLAKGFTTFTVSMSTIGADYAARLAGTTPIDAPPAKEHR